MRMLPDLGNRSSCWASDPWRTTMGSGRQKASPAFKSNDREQWILALSERHQMELETLTLTKQPWRTLRLFASASLAYLKRSSYNLKNGICLPLFIFASIMGLLASLDGPHKELVQELLRYLKFGLWWVGLGVASSIGLGSGLHTFVIYLGPHIALFTIKATQCGRVDLKTAPYDTIQLERGPSWLRKDCSEFGPPVFPLLLDSLVRVPLTSILPQVQLEAVLWGIGTALGELPPYFISRAARMSGNKLNNMEELDTASSKEDGSLTALLKRTKQCLLSHSQHLNFFSILMLASVPNPLFDLAGIMCGQLGVSFWKFFLATLIGKAFIKAHIQTVFIIFLCNNQLLELVEKELIWILAHIPGLASMLPSVVSKLHSVREKYLSTTRQDSLHTKDKSWNLFNMAWNGVIWFMILNLFAKIITSSAQRQLREEHELELRRFLTSKASKHKPKSKNQASRRR